MKFGRSDLKQMRLPAVGLIAFALAGVGCYFAADSYLQETKAQGAAAAGQRADVQGRLDRATEEEREIKANLKQYQELAARGIVGEEKRLDWVDAITAIKSERQLFNIGYSIDPQQALDLPGFVRGGGVEFMVSRLRLDMQLLHEEDLLNFIDDLSKRSKAYVLTRSCTVSRAERGSAGTTLLPRLQAACVFDLVTIRHRKPG